jgi:hypothetical protein
MREHAALHNSYGVQSTVFMVTAHCGLAFFVAAFLNAFEAGFCCSVVTRRFVESWAANRALNLLLAISLEFNTSFFLDARTVLLSTTCGEQGRIVFNSAR